MTEQQRSPEPCASHCVAHLVDPPCKQCSEYMDHWTAVDDSEMPSSASAMVASWPAPSPEQLERVARLLLTDRKNK